MTNKRYATQLSCPRAPGGLDLAIKRLLQPANDNSEGGGPNLRDLLDQADAVVRSATILQLPRQETAWVVNPYYEAGTKDIGAPVFAAVCLVLIAIFGMGGVIGFMDAVVAKPLLAHVMALAHTM